MLSRVAKHTGLKPNDLQRHRGAPNIPATDFLKCA